MKDNVYADNLSLGLLEALKFNPRQYEMPFFFSPINAFYGFAVVLVLAQSSL